MGEGSLSTRLEVYIPIRDDCVTLSGHLCDAWRTSPSSTGSTTLRLFEALAAPTPGCYARHGNWAPTHANWGHDDRNVCIRVKNRDCAPGETYVEYTRGVRRVAFTSSVRHRRD